MPKVTSPAKLSHQARGGSGRGGGRRLESGATAVPKTVTMDPGDVTLLKKLGDGELSRGIRRAAELVRKANQ